MSELLIFWFLLCIGIAFLADSRGRSGFGFFLLSLVLSPLIGLIALLVTKNLKEAAKQEEWQRRQEEVREFDRKRDHEKQLESLKALAAGQAKSAAGGPVRKEATSLADELEKLAALRDRGVLTADEFEAQKKATLERRSE